MRNLKLSLLAGLILFMTSCAEMQQLATTIYQDQKPLSQTEIISGLKQALVVGTDSSVSRLSALDGYLKDEAVKILLPPEADMITNNLSKLPGGDQLVDKVITSINHAASDAAKEAAPILVNSIKQMSIQDAAGILTGGDYAATNYLKKTNYNALTQLYQPKIEASLNKKLVGNLSAQQSWDELTKQWNQVAGSFVGQLASLEKVETNLSTYLTQRALDGLFLKIGETEKNIRQDPAARVTDLLKRVFAKQ
ncbi:DUF4197 domain-containing protein [Sunxiuqinia elliptica]|uniref:Uncharacterized protein DUF4197 n=1 Tax=Sunxiuqinia elliptica TaxID=655355 RepID=A0A4R6GNS1_9BACT|nr:DUF4197 domain-containing protein [Sunxiuqinia elliptica]TDN96753.1 uncharacterized protein DUF4197 [Sunxiuqinia elliptica]TDO55688.1 uncharacterized protein DUF4197 [Sunxiuqinia elliptica]